MPNLRVHRTRYSRAGDAFVRQTTSAIDIESVTAGGYRGRLWTVGGEICRQS